MPKYHLFRATLSFVLVALVASSTSASLVFTVRDTPSGMQLGMTGELDTADLSLQSPADLVFDDNLGINPVSLWTIEAGGDTSVLDYDMTNVTPLSSLFASSTSFTQSPSRNTGDLFVFGNLNDFVAFSFIEAPEGFQNGDILAPRPNVIFEGASVADVFGTNLDAGQVTLATFENGQTLSLAKIAAVPEPSIGSFLSLTGVVIAMRRRRQARGCIC